MKYQVLDDGSYFSWSDDDDPNEVRRQIKERNLAISQEKERVKFANSVENNPATELLQEDIGAFGAAGRGALNGLVSMDKLKLLTGCIL